MAESSIPMQAEQAAVRMAPKAEAKAEYLGEVDALRALAVTAVIIFHCEIMHFGWAGVWLFYVISGFAITTSLLNSELKRPTRGIFLRNFYIRRSLRIWPLYFFYVALMCIVLVWMNKTNLFNHLPWILTYTQNLHLMIQRDYDISWLPFSILWTLALEEQFYLLFPFLYAFTNKRGVIIGLILVIVAAPFVRYFWGQWALAQGWSLDSVGRAVYMFPFAQFDSFAIGCLLAILRPQLEGKLLWARLAFAGAVLYAIVYMGAYLYIEQQKTLGSFLSGYNTLFPHHNFGELREVFLYPAIWAISAALIWLLIARDPWLTWLARIPGLQAIGRVSYGAYIYHAIVIYFLGAFVPWFVGGGQEADKIQRLMIFLTAYPITIGLAFLSYHTFEKRIRDLRHRFE